MGAISSTGYSIAFWPSSHYSNTWCQYAYAHIGNMAIQGQAASSYWKHYVRCWRHYLHLWGPGKLACSSVPIGVFYDARMRQIGFLQDPVTLSIFDDVIALDTNSWKWAQVEVASILNHPF